MENKDYLNDINVSIHLSNDKDSFEVDVCPMFYFNTKTGKRTLTNLLLNLIADMSEGDDPMLLHDAHEFILEMISEQNRSSN